MIAGERRTTSGMSALIVCPRTGGERYLALAHGLTFAEIEAYVTPFPGYGEQFAGVYAPKKAGAQ